MNIFRIKHWIKYNKWTIVSILAIIITIIFSIGLLLNLNNHDEEQKIVTLSKIKDAPMEALIYSMNNQVQLINLETGEEILKLNREFNDEDIIKPNSENNGFYILSQKDLKIYDVYLSNNEFVTNGILNLPTTRYVDFDIFKDNIVTFDEANKMSIYLNDGLIRTKTVEECSNLKIGKSGIFYSINDLLIKESFIDNSVYNIPLKSEIASLYIKDDNIYVTSDFGSTYGKNLILQINADTFKILNAEKIYDLNAKIANSISITDPIYVHGNNTVHIFDSNLKELNNFKILEELIEPVFSDKNYIYDSYFSLTNGESKLYDISIESKIVLPLIDYRFNKGVEDNEN